ncbi:MAG: bifunctional glutamate N-acetyltransferase/amino-acid acetyltransferase ArgJ [Candidatus Omnitrophica bacterium]|nr:bifunctional glutamate N-acetyltransferase/amino-acid acetyltransferase ArgJ [Candidatus Omnitrophota bacterium]MDD5545908.1 bifunctional glutamate N-acetyltransferase/amino-acid acetyltransferase ArgJ [Candidatus Omnitrophota bacterium]
MDLMKIVKGSVTAPEGFLASGVKSGIKKKKLDLALIYSNVPARAAGVFTKNTVKAAPVILSAGNLKDGRAQAIIANSGNANCLNGKNGMKWAVRMAEAVSANTWIGAQDVLVASTGIIGKPLAVEKIEASVPALVKGLCKEGELSAAKAIMTTDLIPKRIAVAVKIGGKTVKIGGIAKGSGMICPNMATLLCFITTDADIDVKALKSSLKDAVEDSLNMVTVDGDMSTNDAVFIMANGLAANAKIKNGSKGHKIFCEALKYVMVYLAKEIAKDGEGASKFIEVQVKGAKSKADAKKMAKEIANSNLVKTAIAGEDPNTGRIASSAGASGVKLNESKLDIYLNGIKIVSGGNANFGLRPKAQKSLKKKEAAITVDLNSGKHSATAWTCDLTEGYIKINARYN